MIPLLVGTAIALLAVGFVLVPLFRDDVPASLPVDSDGDRSTPSSDDAVSALREIEFDRATGKLSETDYTVLKARYTTEAVEAMRADEAESMSPEVSDLAEQAILRYRKRAGGCETCGPRPESDAVYCSTCGRYLPGRCSGCGAMVTESAARFCASCGKTLAA